METDIGIPEDQRKEVVSALAPLLADTYALYRESATPHVPSRPNGPAKQAGRVV